MQARFAVFALPCLLLAAPALAQDPPKMSPEEMAAMQAYQQAGTPGPQHAGLAMTAGDYDVTIKSWSAPGAPPTESAGSVTRKVMLGGRVVSEELTSSMYGQPYTGFGLTGYDNVSGKYWSTWNDSMNTGLTVAEGSCTPQATCSFIGHWNDALTRKQASARMELRWTSPAVEVFEMFGAGPDGKEMKMMEITYTRR